MKKSALILSTLVAVSSVAPVVAMQPGQEQTQSRITQVATNLYNLVRDSQSSAQHLGSLFDSLSGVRNAVDGIVGDQKDQTQNTNSGVSGLFNDTATVVRNNLRSANIPGMEKVVQDDNMQLIKLGLIGLAGYMLMRILVNTFPSEQQQTNNNNR